MSGGLTTGSRSAPDPHPELPPFGFPLTIHPPAGKPAHQNHPLPVHQLGHLVARPAWQPSAQRWLSDCANHYLPSDLPEAGSESFAQNISINLLPSNIKSGKYLEFPDHRISLLLILLLILRHTLGDSRSNIDASYVDLMTEAGRPKSIFLYHRS